MRWYIILWLLMTTLIIPGEDATAQSAFPIAGQVMEIAVEQSFNGDKFTYQIRLDRTTPYYSVYQLTYHGASGKELFGEITTNYYVPAVLVADSKVPPRPGVIALHTLGGNGTLTNLLCANLATNGIPAIMFHMPLFASRCPGGSRDAMLKRPDAVQILGQALELAPEDASRTIDIMLTRPEINPEKINLLGTSMGAIVGATVTERDRRINKAILLLAGGNLPQIIGSSGETAGMRKLIDNASPADQAYINKVLKDIDPLTHAKKLRPLADSGRLMMINAARDEVIPPDCTRMLADQSGMGDRIRMIPEVGHYTAIAALPQLLADFTVFFGDATVQPMQPPEVIGDQQTIRDVFSQLSRLIKFKPDPNFCFLLDASFAVEETGSHKSIASGTLQLLRGTGQRFTLTVNADKLPANVSQLQLGFGEYPWIVSGNGTIYQGSIDPEAAGPEKYLNAKIFLYQTMAAGIFDMAARGMLEPLAQWCKVELRRDNDAKHYVAVDIQGGQQLKIYLRDGSNTPEKMIYADQKIRAEIIFRHWDLTAPSDAAAYDPPAGRDTKHIKVRQKELSRMLAAVCNYMIEGN